MQGGPKVEGIARGVASGGAAGGEALKDVLVEVDGERTFAGMGVVV
jgi:hypothetical protein